MIGQAVATGAADTSPKKAKRIRKVLGSLRHDIADFRENGVEVLIEVTHGHAIHLLFCMGKANGQDLTSLPKTLEGPVIEATTLP